MDTKEQEIERKFCVWGPVDVSSFSIISIMRLDQGYLIADKDLELRVRREFGPGHERYIMAAKGDGALTRDSWDREIPKWVYESLLGKIIGNLVSKQRTVIAAEPNIELDCFFGSLSGLTLLECEFPDEEASKRWTLPDWAACSVEVTSDPVFKNKNLALNPTAAMEALNAIRAAGICGR